MQFGFLVTELARVSQPKLKRHADRKSGDIRYVQLDVPLYIKVTLRSKRQNAIF